MKNKGITLVALVITIIILLILAGITINELTHSGLFQKAKLEKETYDNSQNLENDILNDYKYFCYSTCLNMVVNGNISMTNP